MCTYRCTPIDIYIYTYIFIVDNFDGNDIRDETPPGCLIKAQLTCANSRGFEGLKFERG